MEDSTLRLQREVRPTMETDLEQEPLGHEHCYTHISLHPERVSGAPRTGSPSYCMACSQVYDQCLRLHGMSSLEVPECANKLVRNILEVNRCVESHSISPVWLPGFQSAALHLRFLIVLNSLPRSADTRLERRKKASKQCSWQITICGYCGHLVG